MQKVFLYILIFFSVDTFSQDNDTILDLPTRDTIKHYEIAYCFLGINATSDLTFSDQKSPTYEILNGILLRYKINKVSLRLTASYVRRQYQKDWPLYCSECIYGSSGADIYKLGLGIQVSPIKSKEIIYSFLDVSYKRQDEVGLIITSKDTLSTFNNYTTKINGADIMFGIGSKLKVHKNIYFSTEIAYNSFISQSNKKSTDQKTGEVTSTKYPYYFQTIAGRLYFSLVF